MSDAGAAALEQYFEDIQPAFEAGVAGREAYMAAVQLAFDSMSSDPAGAMRALSDGSKSLAADLSAAHDVVAAAEPPEGLQEAHGSLAGSFALTADVMSEIAVVYAEGAETDDPSDYEKLGEELRRIASITSTSEIEVLMNEWDSAVDEAAQQAGVDLPEWLMDWRSRQAEPWWQTSDSAPQ